MVSEFGFSIETSENYGGDIFHPWVSQLYMGADLIAERVYPSHLESTKGGHHGKFYGEVVERLRGVFSE